MATPTDSIFATAGVDDLPHWSTMPDDVGDATRTIKAALRARLEARGTSAAEVVAQIESMLRPEIDEIRAITSTGASAWPEIAFEDIAGGTVTAEQIDLVRRRGCVVVRNTFERAQAGDWDAEIVEYVERNGFFDRYRGPGDDFFGSLEQSRPEIYPIYWSRPQMEARQSPRMAAVQGFLNSMWVSESHGRQWFDPQRNLVYPDRIRRRPPGVDSQGLGTHLDAGTIDLWMSRGYQANFRHLWNGDVADFDPWDASYRTEASHYPGSTMCSAFRTFQGWTALSDMDHDQGVLHTVPIASAIAYLMARPLLDDVADDDLCGVRLNRAFPANRQWHELLLDGLAGIPDVRQGDTVWWHCDMIHSVAPVEDQRGWGNVMYIPAAPWCTPNEAYAAHVAAALADGSSPPDFPDEHYERGWSGRFLPEDLNEIGRLGLGPV